MMDRKILNQIITLKPEDRFAIIESLLESLDEPDKTIDEIWALEAERRLEAYREGTLEVVPFESVFGENE